MTTGSTAVRCECSYPHDEPWLPGCISCQKRQPRWAEGHTFRSDHCRWSQTSATRLGRQLAGSSRTTPHEAKVKHDYEPTAGLPANIDGRELGQDGEEAVAREDELEAALRASRAEATAKQREDVDLGSGGASGSGHQAYDAPPPAP